VFRASNQAMFRVSAWPSFGILPSHVEACMSEHVQYDLGLDLAVVLMFCEVRSWTVFRVTAARVRVAIKLWLILMFGLAVKLRSIALGLD
jgi:hypothetical protein